MANPFRDMSVIMQALVAAAVAVVLVLVGVYVPGSPIARERDEVDRAVQRHGHVAAFGLQHRDRRLAAELNVAERREGPAQQLAEAAALHDEEHEHGQPNKKCHRRSHSI